ncbi:MAG TPA: efflux RND transporter periplasmic adaptor subunit [Terracidiphilus sp.]|nr:efflux RND transporter periplasmic adaptor subunit [Terracidiphilus sp.]
MKSPASFTLLAAAAALLAGCRPADNTAQSNPPTVSARLVQSVRRTLPTAIRVTGSLHARQSAALAPEVSGRIVQVLVHAGDSVRAGQTLAVLDDATLRAAVDQAHAAVMAAQGQQAAAKADAALAASTLARYQKLQAEKSVSPQEMDEVSQRAVASARRAQAFEEQVKAARAQEFAARSTLGYSHLRAPFAGVVTARLADPGAMASPGAPILQIDQSGPLQLQVNVDESTIADVHLGMKLPVAVDAAGATPLTGTVAEIVPAADPSSHSFLVKIDLAPSRLLRAGMYGTAYLATGTHSAILVPRSAVVRRGALDCAYVVDPNGLAELRYLTLGAADGDNVEVLSGVSANETLVDQPADHDFAGKRIVADSSAQPSTQPGTQTRAQPREVQP